MKNWLCILAIFSIVFATIPSPAHAVVTKEHANSLSAAMDQTSGHANCSGHRADQKASSTELEKQGKADGKCCDGKVCKCLGSACNGPVKIFGSSETYVLVSAKERIARLHNERQAFSDFHTRIKRPPRA